VTDFRLVSRCETFHMFPSPWRRRRHVRRKCRR